MKPKILNTLIAVLLAFVVIIMNVISIHTTYQSTEYGPEFYGFPFIYRSNMTMGCTGCASFYWLGFVGNMIFWTAFFLFCIHLYKKIKQKIVRQLIRFATILLGSFGLFFSILICFFYADWFVEAYPKPAELFGPDATCTRVLEFFVSR